MLRRRLRRCVMSFSRSPYRYVLAFVLLLTVLYHLAPFQTDHKVPVTIVRSGFDWNQISPRHITPSQGLLPAGKPHKLPRIQNRFGWRSRFDARVQGRRREAVKAVFQKCWRSYKQYAWMKDELEPLSATGKDTFGGWAATLLDSLDTLWIMDLKEEFYEAAQAAVTVDWSNTPETACNIFETTIRHLGGLLSAYDLSGEKALLEKAVELGDMLYIGFDTPSQLPGFWLDFERGKSGQLEAGTHEPSASSGSLAMEFTRLSQLTGNSKYYDAVSKITSLMYQSQNSTLLPGMWPTFFNLRDQILTEDNSFTLGALSDSLYEYLPKMHALLGGLDQVYASMYIRAAETIKNHLLFRPMTPENLDILFSGTVNVNYQPVLEPEGQHLTCFVGGMFALGGRLLDIPEHVELGVKLAKGCAWAYRAFPTGIMPEIFSMVTCPSLDGCQWDETRWKEEAAADPESQENLPKGFRNARAHSYTLRPEAIESIFLLYRITGLEEFRETAWDMFLAIQNATETPFCNAAIEDVTVTGKPTQRNSMESFWLAETLKYFYLTFSPPDLVSLDDWVLNTEAHPFRRPRR